MAYSVLLKDSSVKINFMYNKKLIKKEISDGFFGVFTTEDIEEGELIFTSWNDSCVRLTREGVKKLHEPYKTIYEKYCTELQENLYVGPFENEDIHQQIDYFINHCCDPNCWMVNDDDVAARRNIKAGEHITIDYATFIVHEFSSSRIEKCLCGAATCRGKFTRNDWWKMKDVYRGHFLTWIQKKIDAKEREHLVKISE